MKYKTILAIFLTVTTPLWVIPWFLWDSIAGRYKDIYAWLEYRECEPITYEEHRQHMKVVERLRNETKVNPP